MRKHVITSKVTLTLPEGYGSVKDAGADFGQIILLVRKGARSVRVRVIALGDKISIELRNEERTVKEISIGNDEVNAKVLDKDIIEFLG